MIHAVHIGAVEASLAVPATSSAPLANVVGHASFEQSFVDEVRGASNAKETGVAQGKVALEVPSRVAAGSVMGTANRSSDLFADKDTVRELTSEIRSEARPAAGTSTAEEAAHFEHEPEGKESLRNAQPLMPEVKAVAARKPVAAANVTKAVVNKAADALPPKAPLDSLVSTEPSHAEGEVAEAAPRQASTSSSLLPATKTGTSASVPKPSGNVVLPNAVPVGSPKTSVADSGSPSSANVARNCHVPVVRPVASITATSGQQITSRPVATPVAREKAQPSSFEAKGRNGTESDSHKLDEGAGKAGGQPVAVTTPLAGDQVLYTGKSLEKTATPHGDQVPAGPQAIPAANVAPVVFFVPVPAVVITPKVEMGSIMPWSKADTPASVRKPGVVTKSVNANSTQKDHKETAAITSAGAAEQHPVGKVQDDGKVSDVGVQEAVVQQRDSEASFAEAALHVVNAMSDSLPVASGPSGSPHSSEATHAGSTKHVGTNTANPGTGAAYADASLGNAKTLVANSSVLEVGVGAGSHGWLRVRAELGHTGEVTASLVASNAGAAQSLHKDIGAMSDFLKSTSVNVSSLAVTAPERSAETQSVATYKDGGAENFTSDSSGGDRESDRGQTGVPDSVDEPRAARADWLPQPAGLSAGAIGDASGGWLSVRV